MNLKANIKMATNVTTVTLVSYFGEYPRERGNCFSVETEDGTQYRILNFNHENLEKLEEEKVVTFPIKIAILGERSAIIADERIPDEWYSKRFCESCTPDDLLPIPQRLKHLLDIERGIRKETWVEINGKAVKMVSVNVGMKAGYVNAPFTIKTEPPTISGDEEQ